jgi:hypothetical protein
MMEEMEMEEDKVCVFQEILHTCAVTKSFGDHQLTDTGIAKVKASSVERNDDFVLPTGNLFFHKDCYAEYTSKEKIKRYNSKKKNTSSENNSGSAPKRLRR